MEKQDGLIRRAIRAVLDWPADLRKKKGLLEDVRGGRLERLSYLIESDPSTPRLLGKLLFHKDNQVAMRCCWGLRKAAERELDISGAFPGLFASMQSKSYFLQMNSINTLKAAATHSDQKTRLMIADHLATIKGKDEEMLRALISVLKEVVRQDGIHPIGLAKLSRQLSDKAA